MKKEIMINPIKKYNNITTFGAKIINGHRITIPVELCRFLNILKGDIAVIKIEKLFRENGDTTYNHLTPSSYKNFKEIKKSIEKINKVVK